jgi:predicted RNase H-like nuclease
VTRIAGVDGCRAGWIAVVDDGAGAFTMRVIARLSDLLDGPDAPGIVAIDMPIGLPERVGVGGRVAERAVRPMLGPRQSSVFSVPSRSAVHAPDYRSACAAAIATSDPQRAVSRQCFGLFPKIREIDGLLSERPDLRGRIFESHPEVAFAVLSGGRAMATPKKIKGRISEPGLAERRALLAAHGIPADLLSGPPPRGAGADDLVDACACLVVARRLLAGTAIPHPAEVVRDHLGLRIAIWA